MRRTVFHSKRDTVPNYEDILVKRYLEELHSNRNETKTEINDQRNLLLTSPYLQKICNYSLVQRVSSTDSARSKQKQQQRRYRQQQFQVPQTPVTLVEQHKYQITDRSRSVSRTRLSRPSSAPVVRSSQVVETRTTYTRTVRRRPSSFRKKPTVLKALTFKNGTNENPILITSHTIQHFLEAATIKLQLPRAARRLFSLTGQEILEPREFKKITEVFVSCGEDFLDPFFKEKELIIMRKQATWHMEGVRLRNESEERQNQQQQRSDDELDSIHGVHLITVFENGKSNDPIIIDFNFDNDDDADSGRDSDDYDYDDKKVKLFLEKCSNRLHFNARMAYDWNGQQIKCLDDIPKFNAVITINGHVEFAPLWISKGEGFDPYGPLRYVTKFIDFEKQLLRDLSDESLRKLKTFKNYIKREFQNLHINEYIGDNAGELKRFIHYLSNLREKLDDLDKKYESNRSNLLMQHIKEVSTSEKIFGGDASKGLKLRVYINGQDTETTTLYFNRKDSLNEKNRKDIGVKLLLDEINRVMQKNRATGVRFTRIFDENGGEITKLNELEYDTKIWVSAGEHWKSSALKTLTMEFYSLNIHNLSTSPPEVSVNSLQITKVRDYKKSSYWTPLDLHEFLQKLRNNEIEVATMTDDMARRIDLSEVNCFFQCKSDRNLIICPHMGFDQKVSLREKESNEKDKQQQQKQHQMSVQDHFWLNNQFQLWSFHEDGVICNQYFQQLCLSLESSIDIQLEIDVIEKNHTDRVVLNGYAVVLKLRQQGERSKQWKLNSYGQIYNQACGERYVLTSMNVLKQKLDQCRQNNFISDCKIVCTNEKLLQRDHVFGLQLILLDKFPYHNTMTTKLAASQRWAIKQEGMQTIGQWRHSKLTTPEWHKLAYSWPVDEENKLIDEFDWPMVGYLIPKAPPLKTVQVQFYNDTRLNLKVLKNGELNDNNAVMILTPELKRLIKELENCTNITIKQLEFNWFLDNCTSTLNLPFAARRLFDQKGDEYSDLRSFKNLKVDGVKFYVTCGEAWIDPKASRKEIETKTKVLRLLEDYKKLFHYCCLKSCKTCDLVIETANSLAERSTLIISNCILTKAQRKRLDKGESIQNIIEHEEPVNEEDLEQERKNAHQRAHDRQSANKKIKWPWENIANKSMENLVTTEESVDVSQSLKKPKQIRKFNLQKFCYDTNTGYIYCTDNPTLVFGVETSEGNVNEVILMRRNDSDVNQRWSFKEDNNIIALKSRPHLVLTVQYASFEQIIKNLNIDLENDECIMQLKDTSSLQSFLAEAAPEIFNGSTVTLQRYVKTNAGGANQKWHYEAKTGFIFAFKAHDIDIDVTSAIQANICTFNVYRDNACQPGYSCLLTTEDFDDKVLSKRKKKHLCLSCSRDTRGKYKLTKLSDTTEFYCDANKDNTFQKLTGFKYLKNNHQSTTEELFFKCRNDYVELTRRRIDTSPPKFQSRTEYTMKFLAHRNGDGFLKAGEYICGTNIKVLLDQATKKLQLTNAARKIYTEDGTAILDSQDLINYCLSYYQKIIKNMRERGKGLSESRYLKVKQEDIYESGPNLFDLEKIFDGEVDNKTLLKWPVHVWVSTGEQFIHPETVVRKQENKKNMRQKIEEPGNKLDTQTHVLRNMAGRRLKAMEPGVLKPVQNSDYPVTKEGHWSNVPYEEQVKQIEVETLKNEFDKARGPLKSEAAKETVNRSLYDPSSKKKRVLIYANGETADKAIKCWASSLDELIESSKIQLRLNKPVKFIFTQDGKIVTRLDELQQDQVICISTGAAFVKPEERNKEVEAKANWGRVRKAEGDDATHIQVGSSQNPIVDVDPFGPPLVATRSLTYPSTITNENDDDESNNSNTSSTRLKNLRFQHQNKKKATEQQHNDSNNKIDSLLD